MEKMSKDVSSYKSFQENVDRLVFQSEIKKQALTAFSLLESSTLRKQEIFDIPYKGCKLSEYEFQSFDEINDSLEDLKQSIEKKIPKEFLKEKYEKRRGKDFKYHTSSGIVYVDCYIQNFDKLYEEFIESFHIDRFSQFNINRFSISERQKIIIAYIQLAMDVICKKWNMGGLRIICKWLKEMKEESKLSGELNRDSEYWNVVQFGSQIIKKLKSEGDLVDCEFIHLSCFGFQGERCYCYTTDKEEIIRNRLILYCGYVQSLIKIFFDSKNFGAIPKDTLVYYRQQYTRPELKCGKVFILDRVTGEKISEICVQEIYDEVKALGVL